MNSLIIQRWSFHIWQVLKIRNRRYVRTAECSSVCSCVRYSHRINWLVLYIHVIHRATNIYLPIKRGYLAQVWYIIWFTWRTFDTLIYAGSHVNCDDTKAFLKIATVYTNIAADLLDYQSDIAQTSATPILSGPRTYIHSCVWVGVTGHFSSNQQSRHRRTVSCITKIPSMMSFSSWGW